jgi:hypothetical protein
MSEEKGIIRGWIKKVYPLKKAYPFGCRSCGARFKTEKEVDEHKADKHRRDKMLRSRHLT